MFFRFFQQPLLIIPSILTSMHFALLLEAVQQLRGEKQTILFTMKICLIHLLIVSMESPLNGFLRVIMNWFVVNPSCLLHLEKNSLRHAVTHRVLSSYSLYSKLSRGFPFLECLSTTVGIKVTD